MVRQRGNRFQVDVVIDGKRTRKGGFTSREEAQVYERKLLNGLPTDSPTTFGPFIEKYFDRLWGETKAPQATRYNISTLLRHIPAETPIVNIRYAMIEDLVTALEKDRLSNSTINRKLSTLSKILKHAAKVELIPQRPDIPFKKEPKGRERTLDHDEERRCVEYLHHIGQNNSAALFNFLLYTGCRLGEAYKVSRNHVEDGYVKFVDTKNGTDRLVPLVGPAKEAWETVSRYNTQFEYPFKVIPRDTFRDHWNRMRRHMGEEDNKEFVPHMLRHTCCTRLVKADINLPRVMMWMGHKNIQTTMGYTNLIGRDLDMAAKALVGS